VSGVARNRLAICAVLGESVGLDAGKFRLFSARMISMQNRYQRYVTRMEISPKKSEDIGIFDSLEITISFR
jgi:hypothetical protein